MDVFVLIVSRLVPMLFIGSLTLVLGRVCYDILAMRGGAKLYSRMSSLFDTLTDSDGAPTQGVNEVYAEQKRELDQYEAEFRLLVNNELPALNDSAKKLNLPVVIVVEAK